MHVEAAALEARRAAALCRRQLDESGAPVGRMARAFEPPAGEAVSACSVAAVLRWSRLLTPPEFAASVQCDGWEVVLPEFVFEPITERGDGS